MTTDPTLQRKAFRYRIYPTPEQAGYLRRCIGTSRFSYNALVRVGKWRHKARKLGLPDEIVAPKPHCGCGHARLCHERLDGAKHKDPAAPRGKCNQKDCACASYAFAGDKMAPIKGYEPIRLLASTEGTGFLREVNSQIINASACLPYDQAWANWRKNPKHFRGPTYRRKIRSQGSITLQGAPLTRDEGTRRTAKLTLPQPRDKRFQIADPVMVVRTHRPWRGNPKTVGVQLRAGRWYMTVVCEWYTAPPVHQCPGTAVGIDMNVANLFGTNEGRIEPGAAKQLDAIDKLVRRRQRALRRKVKGSTNYRKAQDAVARLQARAARLRDDTLNKFAHDIATKYETIAIEDLSVKSMMASAAGTAESPGRNVAQKRGLNRAIARQGWRMFRTKLEAKAAMYGGRVVAVNPAFTSQTCSACNAVYKGNRYSRESFRCVDCGHEAHADVNSSCNILARGLAALKTPEGYSGADCSTGAPDAAANPAAGAPDPGQARKHAGKRKGPTRSRSGQSNIHGSDRRQATKAKTLGASGEVTRKKRGALADKKVKAVTKIAGAINGAAPGDAPGMPRQTNAARHLADKDPQ